MMRNTHSYLAAGLLALTATALANPSVVYDNSGSSWATQVNVAMPEAINLGSCLNAINSINPNFLFSSDKFHELDGGDSYVVTVWNTKTDGRGIVFKDRAWETQYVRAYGTYQYWPNLYAMALAQIGFESWSPIHSIDIPSALSALTGRTASTTYIESSSDLDAGGLAEMIAKGASSTGLPRAPMVLQTKKKDVEMLKSNYAYSLSGVKKDGNDWKFDVLDPTGGDIVSYSQQEMFDALDYVIEVEDFPLT